MSDYEPGDLVSSADIARLANTTPQAISNWRARNSDFPEAVAGTEKRPRFLYSQILEWLQRNNRIAYLDNSDQDSLGRLIRGISPGIAPVELFAINAFSLALLKIARQIETGSVEAIPGLVGNAEILKASARDGIAEITNGDAGITTFEHLLIDSEGQFGKYFREITKNDSWLATRTALIKYFANSRDLGASYERFALAFDDRFPKESFVSSSPRELTSTLAKQMGKTTSSSISVVDVCAGIGNAIFDIASQLEFEPRVVAIEIDATLCGVIAARAIIEEISVQIFSGDAIAVLNERQDLRATFDLVLCDPPHSATMSSTHTDLLPNLGVQIVGGESAELIWAQICRWLLSDHGFAFIVTSEEAMGSLSQFDVNARVLLLQTQQIRGVLELPGGLFAGTSPNRSWYLLVLQGKFLNASDSIRFVSHIEGLTQPLSVRQALEYDFDNLFADDDDYLEFVNIVGISVIVSEQAQIINRFYGSGDEAQELAEDVRPEDSWSEFAQFITENTDLKDLVFDANGELGALRIGDAVKNRMLKVFSGRSIPDERGDGPREVIHVGKSLLTGASEKRERRFSVDSIAKFRLEWGDILLATSEKGIETLVWTETAPAAPGVGVTVIRVTTPAINASYLAWALRGRPNQALLSDDGRMRFGVINRFSFSIPPIASQNRIVDKLESIEFAETLMYRSIEQLRDVKQRLSTNLAIGGVDFRIERTKTFNELRHNLGLPPRE